MTERMMVERFMFVFSMVILALWLILSEARGDIVEVDRLRPNKVVRKALAAGSPPAHLCTKDKRDLGKAVMIVETRTICWCFGEGIGWVCK